ncbi:TrbC/VirB2 family protein (plasmid) [Lichenicola cladoniae]|uniref:TrbC/VirB2 family protein n=1 Tax=Lichenicola cladoniae TaxID=1484109 RepID=A0A6M8I0R7_9PROT|nr:TrbC/VirB2 family protein [Lichenicola cladoniae]NPD69606.1 TrbC/VirB2 family protein [Acetobacteraceae bacterium]QKE93771.1 TrbC/VirB2 family protein [Lichenicola cladoniae]
MNLTTRNEAAAASSSLSFADTGTRLRSAGKSLEALAVSLKDHAAQSRVVMPGAVAAALVILSMHPAAAQTVTAGGAGSLNTFLTNVMNLITGTTGQIIAVIAIALAGVGAMLGAFSIRAFGGTVLGCAIVFSAAWIVGQITGSA